MFSACIVDARRTRLIILLFFFGEDVAARVQICLALTGAHAYINQPTKRNVFSFIRRTHLCLVDFMLLLIRNINAKQAEIAN